MKKLVGVMLSSTLIMSYAAPLSIRALDDSLISNKDVLASTTDETGYKIYPIPLKMTEKNDILNIKNTVNLVMEENINMYTTNHVEQVLKDNGITYNVSNEVKENETNLLVGIDDEQGIVDKYFEDVNYDASISSQKKRDTY